MNSLTLPAPAKINLFLHVIGQRADGYHLIQTLFQLLDWGDSLTVTPTTDTSIIVEQDTGDIQPHDNIAYKAAVQLQRHYNISQGAKITISKKIPMGGGLGGGSSDAATTLLALNQLWQINTSTEALIDIGIKLGADVPVFLHGQSAWAEGIGEKLCPIELAEKWYLIVKPPCSVPTAEIFSARELTRNTSPIRIAGFLDQGARNDCEPVVRDRYPEVAEVLDWLDKFSVSRMTGTGASCFSQFDDQQSALAVLEQLPEKFSGFVAKGVNISPTHEALKR